MIRGLGDVTVDIHPPSTFHFPTEAQYLGALSTATKYTVDWGVEEVKSALSLPAQSSLTGIKTLVENAAGASLSQIIAGQIAPGAPPQVAAMMTDVLDGAIDLAISGVSATVGNALGDMVSAIPILGQMVGAFVGIIEEVANASKGVEITPQQEQAAEEQAWNDYSNCIASRCRGATDRCSDVRATYYNEKTDGVEKSVADTFRGMAYAMHVSAAALNGAIAIPWCGPMPFVALCGGETEGVLWKNRAEYNAVLASLRAKYNDPTLGIPPEAQRRMWKYAKAICACVNDPRVEVEQHAVGDAGRSMMPMLVDLCWSFCQYNARRTSALVRMLPGTWTPAFLADLVAYHAPTCLGSGHADGAAVVWSGNCATSGYDIVGDFDKNYGFVKTFSDYDIKLDALFGSGGRLTGRVTSHSALTALRATPSRGSLVISQRSAEDN